MAHLDEEKTIAAIQYLAKIAGGEIDFYKLVKLLYFADKKHLHEWGRTITGDRYAKLEHGVTPSSAYNILKSVRGDHDWGRDLTGYFKIQDNTVILVAEPDMDELSESDVEVLNQVYAEDGSKTFAQLKVKAHDKAYNEALSRNMDEEDLAEDDLELIAHIRQTNDDERFLAGP